MNEKYRQEIYDFCHRFADFRGKKIVLYGIGRYTATLIQGLSEDLFEDAAGFNIIGLMDKDPANIGKIYFGLPVVDEEFVKENADIIVINTAGTYWRLIYQRIKHLNIPVYYLNGELAEDIADFNLNDEYFNCSLGDLQNAVNNAKIVSFDFYDTLFSRSVLAVRDVFFLIAEDAKSKFKVYDFLALRDKARNNMPPDYTLDELYYEIFKISKISNKPNIDAIKKLELDIEERLLSPRITMLKLLQDLTAAGKEIYIITDMYFPKEFFLRVLKKYDINLQDDKILISGELRKNKSDGSMWQYYKERIGNVNAVHIGDNLNADIKQAEKVGINAFYVAGEFELLQKSSLFRVVDKICTPYASALMGLIVNKIFQNPFILRDTKGLVTLKTNFEVGYLLFAPVIVTFFLWLINEAKKDNVKCLIFMSRDGYFLQQDFEYFLIKTDLTQNINIKTSYIGISRQLAMTAAATTDEDIWRLINTPYTGTFSELLEDRFNITKAKVSNIEDIDAYFPQIKEYAHTVRENYLTYIKQFQLCDNDAVIDLGYYGNNQYYLNKIGKKNMRGYYFNANISRDNPNTSEQQMIACFQAKDDLTGENSGILKYQIYLESFLTAPYGMVKSVDKNGKFVCAEKRSNQMCFDKKQEINKGVLAFIEDFSENFSDTNFDIDTMFVDQYYKTCFDGAISIDDEVKKTFFNDNAMMHRFEANLFS